MDRRLVILTSLSLVQMWKFFSQYGVRVLLVLYLVQELHYSDARAIGMNAVFIGLVELGGIFGGLIADRFLGLRRSTIFGAWLLATGYFSLLSESSLFLAMGLIVAGSSLFSSNIMALLGSVYEENSSEREKGFTIFYIIQNLGALVSTILCGIVANQYGFRYGFALAASGMVFGNIVLFFLRKPLRELDQSPPKRGGIVLSILGVIALLAVGTLGVYAEEIVFQFLPLLTMGLFGGFAFFLVKDAMIPKKQIYQLLVYLGALILFFAIEDQIFSSLILFTERVTDRTLFGWEISSSLITSINPIVIILLGTAVVSLKSKLVTPFIITGGAFAILAAFCFFNFSISILGVMGVVGAISIAELMIGPLVMSFTSEVAAKGRPGMVMGLVPIAFSLAVQMSGGVGQLMAVENKEQSLEIYGTGFGIVALLMVGGGFILHILMRRFSYEKYCVS
ncbi:MAG: Dipeptide permease D [Chlamydiae bacterium]|nr:Dipeptide permease D [Chlamydiota bacterium]